MNAEFVRGRSLLHLTYTNRSGQTPQPLPRKLALYVYVSNFIINDAIISSTLNYIAIRYRDRKEISNLIITLYLKLHLANKSFCGT